MKNATVYWNGGYISTNQKGLKGKELETQKRLVKAVESGQDSMLTKAGDELPIAYK